MQPPISVNSEITRQVLPSDSKPETRSRIEDKTAAPEVDVGQQLRILRDDRGFSIRALADKCGLAVNTLSLIENGKSSPSVSTLHRIALALEVPITAFFETQGPKAKVACLKAGQRPTILMAHGTLEDLGAGLADRAVEPFIVALEPLAGSGALVCSHTGYEFVYCLEGRLVYTIEASTFLLEPGDSLLFESHLPHRWQNVDRVKCKIILVLYPTDARDHPAEQHFAREE